MARRIITGIDIGSYTVRTVITEYTGEEAHPRILGMGRAESRGMRHGYVLNIPEVVRSIQSSVAEAEQAAGLKIRDAYISIGGIGLEGTQCHGATIISRADTEITHADIERAHRATEAALPHATNKRILISVPIEYRIDGKRVYGRPSGMRGLKLETSMLIVTCLEQHLNDLITAVEQAGIDVVDAMASPIAASFVALSKAQKMPGCVLANIGAETLSIVVYEDGIPISLEVFPVGSSDITNDIALGLRIPLEEAERVKIGKGSANPLAKKKMSEIVEVRLAAMFELISAHLKKIGKHELLPGGIILTGGGSGLETIEDLARAIMRLPSRIPASPAFISPQGKTKRQIKDSTWFVAYGLCVWGVTAIPDPVPAVTTFSSLKKRIGDLFKQILP